MSDFYTARPFISHDGPDANGTRAEVKVSTGFCPIEEMKPSKNGGSYNIVFRNPKSPDYTVNGWAMASDTALINKLTEAFENEIPVYFRIEIKRKGNVDRSKPMSEIAPAGDMTAAKNNIVKSFAAVKLEGDKDWTIGKAALTRIEEDPVMGGNYSAYSHSLEELKGADNNRNVGTSGRSSYQSGFEAPPFVSINPDGDLNPGSNAVSVLLNFVAFISEWAQNKDVTISEEQIRKLAVSMLVISNRLQVAIYNGKLDKADLSLGSHTRARAIIYDVIKHYFPINNSTISSKGSVREWEKNVYETALDLWQWSMSVTEGYVFSE